MPQTATEQIQQTPRRPQSSAITWFYGPWLDLIVGCGAWSLPLLLLAYAATPSHARGFALAFYALALFFNYPHYMATIYRAYHRAEDFQKYRIFTVHITAVLLLTALVSHFWIGLLPWIFTLYLTWSPWHYTGQNYGVFMMFARRAGVNLCRAERHAIYGAFIVSYIVLFISFHTGVSSDTLFISIGIPAVAARFAEIGLGAVFVALSAYGLWPMLRDVGLRKLSPALTMFSSQILWFLFPVAMTLVRGLEIPQSRYSTGVLAVMHSAQYLWVTSYYASREAKESNRKNWRVTSYFAILVIGGIALFVPGPWLASRVFHHDFTVSFLILTALVNLHHFILDGAIWKLRDGRVASLLLNSKAQAIAAASRARGRIAGARELLFGNTAGTRLLRTLAAISLLAWGVLDQTRYYLALHSENLRDLQRAAALNSFDSSTQMRLAQREFEDGHAPQAEAAWRSAIQSNPADPAPRQALLHFLIEKQRFDDAYDLAVASLAYTPGDANLWVDRGLLELRRGESDEAIASWNKAITLDPNQMLAHFYLASELDHTGKPQDAIGHYKIFLTALAHQAPAKRPPAEKVIAIVLRMADCQARLSRTADAEHSYELAAQIASETKQIKLQSLANVNEAALLWKVGRSAEALHFYQHALQLDESIGDRTSSAEDWLAYGRFLEDAGFPPRLAYACFLKSAELKDALPDATQRQYLSDVSRLAAERVGRAAGALRANPEPALREALSLQR